MDAPPDTDDFDEAIGWAITTPLIDPECRCTSKGTVFNGAYASCFMADTIGNMILAMIQILISIEATPITADVAQPTIQYGRDIRPILSDRCFHCHGPDDEARQASLRLDSFESATSFRNDRRPIVPGDATASPVWQRISSGNPNDQMPPPGSGKHRLDEHEIELVRQWIDAGAEYEPHWAFEPS